MKKAAESAAADRMTGPEQAAAALTARTGVPTTGDPAIDDALQGLHDLPSTPLSEHHDRLARCTRCCIALWTGPTSRAPA